MLWSDVIYIFFTLWQKKVVTCHIYTLIMFADTDFLKSCAPCWLLLPCCCLPLLASSAPSDGGLPPVTKALNALPKFSMWTFCCRLMSVCMDGTERWALLPSWEVVLRGADREVVGGLPFESGNGLGGGFGLNMSRIGYLPGTYRVTSDTWASSLRNWNSLYAGEGYADNQRDSCPKFGHLPIQWSTVHLAIVDDSLKLSIESRALLSYFFLQIPNGA